VIDPSEEPPSPPPEATDKALRVAPITPQPTIAQPTVASQATKPPLESLISVHDFEDVARQTFTKKTYAFYSSAATDLVAQKSNIQVWRQLLLRPQILRNVSQVSTKRRILGCHSSAPFFVSPTAMAKLAHPDGELATARACGNENIIQCVGHPFAAFHALSNPNRSQTTPPTRSAPSSRLASPISRFSSSSMSTRIDLRPQSCSPKHTHLASRPSS
jgi:hypothetical protein